MEPVFRTLEITAEALVRATGTEITFRGLENLPATGGAVIAINHTGYVDFLPAALAVSLFSPPCSSVCSVPVSLSWLKRDT